MAVKISGVTLVLALAGFSGEAYAQSVEIDNAVARVVYRVENRSDIEISVVEEGRTNLPPLIINRSGRNVKIDGQLTGRTRIGSCNSNRVGPDAPSSPGANARVTVRGVGTVEVNDAPLIIIKGPRNASINTSGAVYGSVARGADNVEIYTGGCGGWVIGNVRDKVTVSIGGSGNVWTGSARAMQLNIGGSGTVRSTRIDELDINIGGSGNVEVGEVSGDVDVRVGGSGNVEINNGRIGMLKARVAGSGTIRFDGTVRDLDASIMGAGNIEVDRVTGNVSRRVVGIGTVRIRNE